MTRARGRDECLCGRTQPRLVLVIRNGTLHSSRLALLRTLQGDERSWGLFCWSLAVRSPAQLSRQREHQLDCPRQRDDSHSISKSRCAPNISQQVASPCCLKRCPQIVLAETNRVMTCDSTGCSHVQPVKAAAVDTVACLPRAPVIRLDTGEMILVPVLDSKTNASKGHQLNSQCST